MLQSLKFNVFNFFNQSKKTTMPLVLLCPAFPYTCESSLPTFSTMKQVKSTVKTETEWQTKHWTIVSDLLAATN